jgi:hypothetical protein
MIRRGIAHPHPIQVIFLQFCTPLLNPAYFSPFNFIKLGKEKHPAYFGSGIYCPCWHWCDPMVLAGPGVRFEVHSV